MIFNKKGKSFRRLLITAVFAVISLLSFAQGNILNGTVNSSEDGEPLIGVSIQIKGTSTGTVTDLDGKFSLKVNSENTVLIFSMIGMKTI